MNRSKRKHTTTGKCRCSRCEAIAAGKTPAEADADYRKWEQANMQNHGWIIHFVAQGDESSPTGFNAHTHGLQQNYDHADFQVVIPLPQQVVHTIMITLADRVKAAERFQAGQTVADVIEGGGRLTGQELLVKLVDATEGGRPVLRVILPDPNGKLDLGEINAQYARQYADLAHEKAPPPS